MEFMVQHVWSVEGGEECRVLWQAGLPTVGSWVMLQHVMVGNTQWKLHKTGGSWGNGR